MIHLIHDIRYGGVESAVVKYLSSPSKLNGYKVIALGINKTAKSECSSQVFNDVVFSDIKNYNILSHIKVACRVANENDDNVVISSLWRSHFVATVAKMINPKLKIISFHHNARFVHFFDFLFSKIILKLSFKVLCDSQSVKDFIQCENAIVIPFIFPISSSTHEIEIKQYSDRIVFFGRINKQKNLRRAVDFISLLHSKGKAYHFDIYGEDDGELNDLKIFISQKNLNEFVHINKAVAFNDVQYVMSKYRFLLQLSDFEGFGMSVAEALQVGIVPVVTPVGEIGSYCKDNHNSIVVDSQNLLNSIERLILMDESFYTYLSNNAKATFPSELLFPSVFNEAVMSTLND